ncbi:MAG: PAS domain-containing sensor histidine kinase [Nanoarchaeota archaeon]|nr:PAS domain-containing sensor histidine kinase [Nanoarchaeota archaeon]
MNGANYLGKKMNEPDAKKAYEYAEGIINTVREPLIVLDGKLKVISASRSFYNVFKTKPEEVEGKFIYEIGKKQWDIPELRELLEKVLPGKSAFNDFEVEHDFVGVGRKIMLLNAREINGDKPKMILLAIEDITEQKRDKVEAIMAKEYSESLVNTMREPLIVLDKDLRVTSANSAFYSIFKVNEKETRHQLIYDLGNGQWDIPELKNLLEKVLPEKKLIIDFEVEHTFPDIGRKIMLLNARQLDHVPLILLAIEDITQRINAEKGLEKSEEKLKMIADNISDVLLFYDKDHNLVYANSAIEKLTGYSVPEITRFKSKDKFIIYLHPDDNERIKSTWDEFVSGKKSETKNIEFRIVTKDKKTKWISSSISHGQSKGENKNQTGIYVVYHDITQKRESEEKIKDQLEQLKELDTAKTDFMNVVSHELKTPLTAIYANLELLEEIKSNFSEKNINNLNALRRNSNQLKFLIDNILEIARIQSNKFELNISEVDLGKCIEFIVNEMKILADRKKVKLILEENSSIKISTDKTRLIEIMNNLIDNAIKFTDKGEVKVNVTKKDENNVLIEVTDTGIGIPKDKQSKLFEKFYQIHNPLKSEVGGTGLGLSITKQMVELLGGEINFKSKLDEGSTFYFTLPIRYIKEVKK